ncbi:MAG TPA: nucleoside-diphosphate kinase [Candidatus Saccharimonadales bacterium]
MERTLIILKPDAMQRGITGEIITRFERVGLKIVAAKVLRPSEEHYFHHYETIGKMISRRGQEAFDVTLKFMQEGPILAMVLEGVEAVSLVRKMVGTTEPKAADPGTIRGDYSHISFEYANNKGLSIPNLIHASGDPAEAKLEIAHWFKKNEIFVYPSVHDKFTLVS